MFAYQEQLSAATKAQLEAQIALLTTLTNKVFESTEKLIDLNLTAAKASLEESTNNAQQLLSAKDFQEALNISAAQAQPNVEKALAYGQHLFKIASSAQSDIAKAAETQIADSSRKIATLVDEVSKSAPTGSENAFAILKSALGSTNAGYEQLLKTSKQAAEAIEVNLNNAAAQFTQATKTAARPTTKK